MNSVDQAIQERQQDVEATIRLLDNARILAQQAADELDTMIKAIKSTEDRPWSEGQIKALKASVWDARKQSNPIRSSLDTAFLCVETFADRERARMG